MQRRPRKSTLPPETRQRIAEWREALRSELQELADHQGKLLYDGEWLTPKQVKWHKWRLRWRSLRMILATLFLCFGLILMAGILWLMLILMGAYVGS